MKEILVETSARHVHVNEEQFKILFGQETKLEVRAPLSQPGQFVSFSRVDVVGPKKSIANVSILGPFRKSAQVEVSATDARTLGVPAVIRESGNTKGSAPIKLVGPNGEIELAEGCIVAKRHIHMTPKDAEEFGVKNGEIVKLEVNTPDRSLVFGDVVIRVRDDFSLACHIDTDEANAAGCASPASGKIVK
ncbi:MAG TPA: phosphate propanoyltransferase [Bacilli bacterium]|nr:phosphate propanoyltransferase [Bacilli bacterium]HPS19132.1 phosphate propanoyltransferase [Bacilli bacterium]